MHELAGRKELTDDGGVVAHLRGNPVARASTVRTSAYIPPEHHATVSLLKLLEGPRSIPAVERQRFAAGDGTTLHYAGDLSLLNRPCVSIVGTRQVSSAGAARARRLARELVAADVVVVSGLAKGVDANAHMAAIEAGGRTVAVIGTPLEKAYPAENKRLQEQIYQEHLLVSQFAPGSAVYQGNFPARNRVMAALSDATVIIEAGETSGTLHQAVECRKLGRWLFIAKSVVDNPELTWPQGFIGLPRVRVLASTEDLLSALRESGSWR